MTPQPVVHTARLTLRRADLRDLDDLHRVLSHPAAMRYWSTPEHDTPDQTRRFLTAMIGAGDDSDDYLIEHDGRVIGKAGAWRLPEIGFILHPDFWRRGLGREAMEAVIPLIFSRHPLDTLIADADPRNDASLALLGRLGFVETHRIDANLLWRDEWCDTVYLALSRAAWTQRTP